MNNYTISTGHAAELCGVTRDTVFKWVKKGKIEAVKTAGGHFRINMESLEPYLTEKGMILDRKDDKSVVSFCWEYHARNGRIKDGCRQCMVFLAKAEKCYLLAGFGESTDHPGIYCKSSCFECEYFKYLDKPKMNVLLISENTELREQIKAEISKSINLQFSTCGYEAATIIHDFHPDFIVIDNSLVSSRPDVLCKHLINDPRLHGAQIVLAVSGHAERQNIQEGICATIRVPFTANDMEKCFAQLQSNIYGAENLA
ncbi:helix-turn-helix domain-containing protein [candidate division KSB1 bacterium]